MTATPTTPEVLLEVLYLDAEHCDPCRSTLDTVDEAATVLAGRLRDQGRSLVVRTIHVTDQDQADALGFVSSPTVRVDGVDIELDVQEQACPSCSALAGEPVDCRTFAWRGRRHAAPPAEMIIDRVLAHLATTPRPIGAGTGGGVGRFLAARGRGR